VTEEHALNHEGLNLLMKFPDYRRLWLSSAISGFGDQIGWIALIWLVLHLTGSSAAIGIITLAYQIPQAVTGPIAGVLLDRYHRPTVMAIGNMILAVLFIAIPMAGILVRPESVWLVWLVYVLVAISGALLPLTNTGVAALIPQVVPAEKLSSANFFYQTEWQLSYLLGPAVGGVLISIFGAAPVLLVDAVSFAICAWLVRRLSIGRQSENNKCVQMMWGEFREGLQYLLQNRALIALSIVSLFFYFLYGPYEVVLPLLASTTFGGAKALGILWSAFAVGSTIGSMTFSARNWRYDLARSLAGIVVLWGIVTVVLAYAQNLIVASILMFCGGVVFSPWGALSATARQQLVPHHMQGRVFGVILSITSIGMPLGAWVSGLVLDSIHISALLLVAGVATVLVGALALISKSFRSIGHCSNGLESVPDITV
jgi:MFS family permease